ncbi:pullulanase [Alkalibacterium sp.]|nr:MAG: pullulanase [Alkalibacterium sp.]
MSRKQNQNLTSAMHKSESEIELFFKSESMAVNGLKTALLLEDNQGNEAAVEALDSNVERRSIQLTGDFLPEKGPFSVSAEGESVQTIMSWQLKDKLFSYDGELGAQLHSDGTADLKVWSPSAELVSVRLYDKTDQNNVIAEALEMEPLESGVWHIKLDEENTGLSDLTGYFYHFVIQRNGSTVLTLDPYAKSLAAWDNTNPDNRIAKAALVNIEIIGPELDYAQIEGYEKREDAVIYEVHVRDFTSDPSISDELTSQFGTFTAFIDKLDYIKSLGVTHIQLLPVMSYYVINEFKNHERLLHFASNDTNYNWGYDPQSYFALTGMYSEDPTDPAKRIEEFKQLVKAIHDKGMGVTLDVVYNHTNKTHIFEDLEPHYYHFMDRDGTARESFGGGRMGTTHAMARRILVDSITHWVKEYKVDGFRFDMMGDHDAESIQLAYDAASELNPSVLMIGEGWRTYAGDEGYEDIMAADQDWIQHTEGVASFSDDFRNELKSGFLNEGEPSFLTGGARSIQRIFDNLTANPHNFKATNPGDVVPYIEAHDNLTTHDVIAVALQKDPDSNQEEIHRRLRLGNLLLLTAQGTAFLHAGQEYGRTKQFRDDSFTERVPDEQTPDRSIFVTDAGGEPFIYPYFIDDSVYATDAVNKFDWKKALDKEAYPINTLTQSYTKGLIALRRSTDAFRKGTMEEIAASVSLLDIPEISEEDLVIAYRADDSNGDSYYVFVNADETERVLTLDKDLTDGYVIVDSETAGTEEISQPIGVSVTDRTVTLAPLTAAVLVIRGK